MKSEIITIWDWLAISDEPKQCDLIFLFGGSMLETQEMGLRMFEQGYAKQLIANGNTGTFANKDWDAPDAEVFAKYLLERGLPPSALIIQNSSMNTLEDVNLGLKMLDDMHIKHDSVMLISRPSHQRRAYATYKMQDPRANIINIPCEETSPNLLEGEAQMLAAVRCVEEYERLIRYAAKGDIVGQQIPQNVKAAYEAIRPHVTGAK